MNQESDLFKNLSTAERSVLRQDQLERTYLNFTSNGLNFTNPVNAKRANFVPSITNHPKNR